jgi:hypothetical protein
MNSSASRAFSGTAIDLRREERRRLEWFANYLAVPLSDPQISEGDFAAVLAAAVDTYGVALDRLCDRFAVNKSTVSRWKNGKSAPHPFARPIVVDWIKSDIAARIEQLT